MSRKTALRSCMLVYNIVFWLSGCALIFLGLWMILDPRRNYILDLVDFSEDDPLLRFASYTAIVSGIITIFVGFMSCCGAIQAERCMILTFIIFILLLFFAELTIGVLGVLYKEKFSGDRMRTYITNMSHNRYYRDKWVTPLLDTIQFYILSKQYKVHMKYLIDKRYGIDKTNYQNYKITELVDKIQLNLGCCGIDSRDDWNMTEWRKSQMNGNDMNYFDSHSWRYQRIKRRISNKIFLVPISCCKGRSHILSQFVPKSYMRCQTSNHPNWIHTMQECCGGEGPKDYEYSFWYITNTERGTRSFVPYSCCKQSQNGRAWHLIATDPMCITYSYFSQPFNNSIHTEGCHKKLKNWFDEQSIIFMAIGFCFAGLQMIGLIIATVLWHNLDDYRFIQA
uniref:Tetraspanin n=1 Tax=Strongyloides venezuelensis TaxID=75913 RepID=A0A0K0FCL0_STRVS